MSIIALVGPHAVGKTTAAKRWVDRYRPRLLAALADTQRVYDGVCEVREKDWKGTLEDKLRLLAACRASGKVWLVESGGPYGTQVIKGLEEADRVIYVHCSPAVLLANLRARCEAKGKRLDEAYWNPDRLEYECFRRLDNCIGRELRPGQAHVFKVDDYARDWPAVDECFAALFRRAHNLLRRA